MPPLNLLDGFVGVRIVGCLADFSSEELGFTAGLFLALVLLDEALEDLHIVRHTLVRVFKLAIRVLALAFCEVSYSFTEPIKLALDFLVTLLHHYVLHRLFIVRHHLICQLHQFVRLILVRVICVGVAVAARRIFLIRLGDFGFSCH